MNFKTKDVINFYLGCEVDTPQEGRGRLMKYDLCENICWVDFGIMAAEYWAYDISDIKLIIRPLSSMTQSEMEECGNLVYDFKNDKELNTWTHFDFEALLCPEQFYWLLSKQFDLFGLISSGEAIDATIKKQ